MGGTIPDVGHTSVASRGDPTGPPAFVFDIDGVLIRGKDVLPTAKKAMAQLCPGGRWTHAVCFMTNGGGMLEEDKAQQLSTWLDVPVKASQVILSHTPMQQLVPRLRDRPVLVSGRGRVLDVARHYGFGQVLSTYQLGAAMPTATPFASYLRDADSRNEGVCPVRDLGLATEQHPVEAVLVMSDPDDWYRDMQLIVDVVMSGGVPQRRGGPAGSSQAVQLYFSNPDLLWANEFPRSRFGQGAFAHAVMGLCTRVAEATSQSVPLSVRFYGKPNPEPYAMAEQLLLQQAAELGIITCSSDSGGSNSSSSSSDGSVAKTSDAGSGAGVKGGEASERLPQLPFSSIFAVGDNPAADVRGANARGPPWVSVLVQTGVFQGPGLNCTMDPAAVPVSCVAAAVEAGLHRARFSRFHSMR